MNDLAILAYGVGLAMGLHMLWLANETGRARHALGGMFLVSASLLLAIPTMFGGMR
jgi:hypothetical protein